METLYQIGNRSFPLDQDKAKAAFAAKRVINGRATITFNLLPLRYAWAYDQYREMKNHHWGPMASDVAMHVDAAQWRGGDLTAHDRWLVQMTVGCLLSSLNQGAAEIQQVIRELVTAPELKLVLGREVHQENLRLEALLFMIYSLGLNPHECEAIYTGSSSHRAGEPTGLSRAMDLSTAENRRLLARKVFHFGQCEKGLRHYALFAALLDLDPKKLPGTRKLLDYILRDESSRVEVLRSLFLELVKENPELNASAFREELSGLMRETAAAEKAFVREALPTGSSSFSLDQLAGFIDHIANSRLHFCSLPPASAGANHPLPKLSRLLHLRENPSGQRKGILDIGHDDDL